MRGACTLQLDRQHFAHATVQQDGGTEPIQVMSDPGFLLGHPRATLITTVAEHFEFLVHQSDGATEPITQATPSTIGATAQVSLEASVHIGSHHDDGSDDENYWSSDDENDVSHEILLVLESSYFLRRICAGDEDDMSPLPTKMLAYHYAHMLRHPSYYGIPQIPLLSNCWSYWASLLGGRSSSGQAPLMMLMDELIVRWTITVSDNRTLLGRDYWSISMNVGVMEPLPAKAFQPTRPEEDDVTDNENRWLPLVCEQRGFIPDVFRHPPGFEHQLLVSYLFPSDAVEVQTDEVFDHRDIGHLPQNMFRRYSQGGVGWARCYWCWRWRFSIGYHIGVSQVADPLCDRCRLLKEPPWYPNNRQRAELYFQHALSQQQNGYHDVFVLQAEALAAYLADPGEP